jgi:uncharacterized membrane protein YgdD (TMEM256/DUF423 family)
MILWSRILTIFGGLMGACAIALSAYAAHMDPSSNLVTASQYLIIHAVAVASLSLTTPRRMVLGATSLLVLGALLFCGDLTLRVLAGRALFHMAAPLGGIVLIIGWLTVALSAFTRR